MLALALKFLIPLAGTAVSALLVRQLARLFGYGKSKASLEDQSKLNDLELLVDEAVARAIAKAGEDAAAGRFDAIALDALNIFRALVTPRLFEDLGAVLHVTGDAIWSYVRARINERLSKDTKVLSVPPGDVARFEAKSLQERRELIAAKGTPTK